MEKYSLVGVDGNVYSIIGYTQKAMRKEHKSHSEIEAYTKKVNMAKDYYDVISISDEQIQKLNEKYESDEYEEA